MWAIGYLVYLHRYIFIATFYEESYTTMFFIIQIRLFGIGINISKVIYLHRLIRLNIYEIFLKHNM